MHQPDPALVAGERGPVVEPGDRRGQRADRTETHQGGGGAALAGQQVHHGGGDPGADRHLHHRGVQWMAEPHAVQRVAYPLGTQRALDGALQPVTHPVEPGGLFELRQ